MDWEKAKYVFPTDLGCESHVKKLTSDKLAPKTDKCLFVEYPKETKAYYFYNPKENKVFIARKAVLLEKEFIFKKNSGIKVELQEVQEPQTPIQDSMEMDKDSQEAVDKNPNPLHKNREGPVGFVTSPRDMDFSLLTMKA